MQGHIDTSYLTLQRDFFESGLAAQIGANAFVVWNAIKIHADYATGTCFPGVRRLMQLTGLANATVQKALATLMEAKLVRVVHDRGRGKRRDIIARERLDIRLGDRVICTIVIDYVPNRLKNQLRRIANALQVGEKDDEAFADVEIIPGRGFVWDSVAGSLRASIQVHEIPVIPDTDINNPLISKIREIRTRATRVPKIEDGVSVADAA